MEEDENFCENSTPKYPQIKSAKQKKDKNSEYWPHLIKEWHYFDDSEEMWDKLIINETIIFNLATGQYELNLISHSFEISIVNKLPIATYLF